MFYVVLSTLILYPYLLGSISFAVIITRIFIKQDIRDYGSGNAGMTNVMRVAGKVPGTITLIFDAFKGYASVWYGIYIIHPIIRGTLTEIHLAEDITPRIVGFIAGIICVIGHFYPVYFSFKGGKGVAATAGVVLALSFFMFLFCLTVFLVAMFISKTVSVGSIAAAISVPLSVPLFIDDGKDGLPGMLILAFVFTVLVILKHKENIKRLIKGEENKIGKK